MKAPQCTRRRFSWNVEERVEGVVLDLSPEQQAVADVAQNLLDYLDRRGHDEGNVDSEDEEVEWSDASEPESQAGDEDLAEHMLSGEYASTRHEEGHDGRKRARLHDPEELSREWFPWHDRITCTLDILMHLPRSVFSQKQLDLFLWLLKVNGVDDVPTVASMLRLNSVLQKLCGIETVGYNGALGHKYFVNNLAQIIAQLSEARQADRWLHELPADLTTPVARIGGNDYFILEPAMLRTGECCMPVRWFTRRLTSSDDHTLFARCLRMVVVSGEAGDSWRVIEDEGYEVSQHDFLKNFPALQADATRLYNLPSPSLLSTKARGYRTLAFPLWMYCDDTSGNVSKKWNKHNSFLFTPAGLSRAEVHKEYNMLDGIVDQLEDAQANGIWAWDSTTHEPVLIIPSVLALLGDNPMQSEFACHIGLRGKLFCRACWVKGFDGADNSTPSSDGADNDGQDISDASSVSSRNSRGADSGVDSGADSSSASGPGKPRRKAETVAQLRSAFVTASTRVGKKTALENERTETGIKDTYQLHFLQSLFSSYKSKSGQAEKLAALQAKVADLPSNTMSPVRRIHGLDPHSDTPVEILHVVLLGFVKYFWRDLIQNQLKKKDDLKALLKTRLSSIDVSGLGISPLDGDTLVQYAGSLTGRDFRAIAQVAPFVIYDMVSEDCYEAWVSLSKLIPMIWQPIIEDLDEYLPLLRLEIHQFLLCTARWTAQWFNKPKFHILVHLPDHIRRFGPSILFATEAFESFNAVIRAKSVHSNRHAPSRDIALAFAQGNRLRHLISGGYFARMPSANNPEPRSSQAVSKALRRTVSHPSLPQLLSVPSQWQQLGSRASGLIAQPSTITRYLGLSQESTSKRGQCRVVIIRIRALAYILETGSCKHDSKAPQPFTNTLTGQHLPRVFTEPEHKTFKTCTDYFLENGDHCTVGQHVVVRSGFETYIAAVREIIQTVGSVAYHSQSPSVRICSPQGKVSAFKEVDLLCTVNVQHRCIAHQCQPTGSHFVFEEQDKCGTLCISNLIASPANHSCPRRRNPS
ncbi:hypothetical protein EV121DRAFT_276854 [Schizophyllum commune]